MGHERHAGLGPVTGDEIDHTFRQIFERVRQAQRGQRRVLAGLGYDGVARGQGRGELPDQQEQRVIPRHDQAAHAERLLDHEVELVAGHGADHASQRVAADLRVVVEARGDPLHLVPVLRKRLAAFLREQDGETFLVLANPAGAGVQLLGSLDAGRAAPLGKRPLRGGHSPVAVGSTGPRRGLDHFFGGGVHDIEDATVACPRPPPADPHLRHANTIRSAARSG